MVLINYAGREINAKIVYYGPGLSGKTTNLECIYASVPGDARGKMVSMKTRQDRTLFFDFLPLELGEIHGFRTRFLLYTVPGQVFYNATRKLVLKGADAVVFVADSTRGKLEENQESLRNLEENLQENNLTLDAIPWVIQFNKRDLAQVHSVDELQRALNPWGVPAFEAAAATGRGVYETLHAVSRLLFQRLRTEFGRHTGAERRPPESPGAPVAEAPSRLQPNPQPAAGAMGQPGPSRLQRTPLPRPGGTAGPSTALQNPIAAPRLQAGPPVQAQNASPHPGPRDWGSVDPAAGEPEPAPFLLAPEDGEPDPVDYGHTVDLPAFPARPEPGAGGHGFIRDPLRRREPEADGKPGAVPTLSVPVVIKQGDIRPGEPLQLLLEIRIEP
jgi:hypothetical protein